MLHALKKVCPGYEGEMHGRVPEPILNSGRIIAGTVRDPWDWYISMWAYGCDGEGVIHNRLTGRRRVLGHGYRDSLLIGIGNFLHELIRSRRRWREVYTDSSSPEKFRSWLTAVLDPSRSRALGENFHRSTLSGFAGFYTYRYCRLFHRTLDHLYDGSVDDTETLRNIDRRSNIVQVMMRTEDLTRGILQLLDAAGVDLSPEEIDSIRDMTPTNPSTRKRETSFYYDGATSEMVRMRDSLIVEKYGYGPPEI